MVRAAYLIFYAGWAALGAAAVAPPALLWVREVRCAGIGSALGTPTACAFILLGLAIATSALRLALDVALDRRPAPARHATLLALVAIAAALRTMAESPPAR